jgi:NTP pyrophosphatase (non-canonical NTP hydrolase)
MSMEAIYEESGRNGTLPLTFDEFSRLNAARCEAWPHYGNSGPREYPASQLVHKIAGEAGELAQEFARAQDIILNGGSSDLYPAKVLDEIADVVTYCDLLCSHYGVNLYDVLVRKFNVVSDRVGLPEYKMPVRENL